MKTYKEFVEEINEAMPMPDRKSKVNVQTDDRKKLFAKKYITNDEYDSAVKSINDQIKKEGWKTGSAERKALQNEIYDFAGKLTASMKAGHKGAEYRDPTK
ncbi:hypothetical protein [Erwinia phage FBB1]|nr:hypothetical protein [Erwinia phage FBB1]